MIIKTEESDLVSKPPDKMYISNIFQTYDNIVPGNQLLFTANNALSTDLETEFQFSRRLVSKLVSIPT